MPAEGFIQVHVYTTSGADSRAGAACVARVADDGTLLAARLTNESGQIQPVAVKVPDASESRDPNFRGKPFTTVSIRVQHPDYEQIQVDNAQVFAGVITLQPLELIPLPTFPEQYDRVEYFDVPPPEPAFKGGCGHACCHSIRTGANHGPSWPPGFERGQCDASLYGLCEECGFLRDLSHLG